MKVIKLIALTLIIFSVVFAQNKKPSAKKETPAPVVLKTAGDSISYAIGQNIFASLKDPLIQLNLDVLIASLKDAANGKPILTEEKTMQCLTELNQKMQARQSAAQKATEEKKQAEMAPVIEKNKKEGEAFLEENKKKEGVLTTASGLQYKILSKGTGEVSPKATDQVKVHYKGTLLDGKPFDSSYDRNEPATFPLSQVIKGWTEGLQLMHVGDKFQFFIPYDLGYGEMGRGETIPPATVLTFEVELLDIVK
ncbi:MAG: peptidylprolyl isomerase [Ignavibacteria bacterium CG_4_8_14_3_um_filter_37_9]|nr:MAG: peptidylprolyl isomerase [Ignavibacteria bacterium CG22_combo_CG10-13_8_21_14_all_37_15]PIW99005.1 MAG: peptidylprolyl isomerase [Ignavibacteria bacterium CG_4_8_14_3_um_filter_37_9]